MPAGPRPRETGIDDEAHVARERLVDVLPQMVVRMLMPGIPPSLQQIRDFGVGIAVVRILHGRALAEQRVASSNSRTALALAACERLAQVLLGRDVLADDLRQIDFSRSTFRSLAMTSPPWSCRCRAGR
jgi:hypothetical protein